MNQSLTEARPRPRDPGAERRERLRFELLEAIYHRAGGRCEPAVPALEIGRQLRLPREELFRAVLDLTHREYLDYQGAGPMVKLTPKGVGYLQRDAGRRRSIRG